MNQEVHRTVFLEEGVAALNISPSSVVVDATAGAGGHASLIREHLDEKGMLIVFDVDCDSLMRVRTRMSEGVTDGTSPGMQFVCTNFRRIKDALTELGIGEVDGVIADLGWSSEQFEGGGRGFSFKEEYKDEPLLMTYGRPEDHLFSARDIVNEWKEEDIANVLYGYGEERYARRIARRITEVRAEKPIETAGELATCIEGAVPSGYRRGKTHPATKSFQALRIAVNDELAALTDFMRDAPLVLKEGGRLAVITFHSIEDRIVKHALKDHAGAGVGTIITKKPIVPSPESLTRNPRARSAKLRIFEKT